MSQMRQNTVKGYKSIRALGVFELRPLNVLIVPMALARAISSAEPFLHAMYEQQLQLYAEAGWGRCLFVFWSQFRMELAFWFRRELAPCAARLPGQLAASADNRFAV